jgi:hypothetical protein
MSVQSLSTTRLNALILRAHPTHTLSPYPRIIGRAESKARLAQFASFLKNSQTSIRGRSETRQEFRPPKKYRKTAAINEVWMAGSGWGGRWLGSSASEPPAELPKSIRIDETPSRLSLGASFGRPQPPRFARSEWPSSEGTVASAKTANK